MTRKQLVIKSKDGVTWSNKRSGKPFMKGYPQMSTTINDVRWVLCSWDWQEYHSRVMAYRYKIAFWVAGGPKYILDTNDKEEAIARYTQIMNYPLTESVLAVL